MSVLDFLNPIAGIAGKIIDGITGNQEEKTKATLQIQTLLNEAQKTIEQSWQTELAAKADVLKAEMQFGNNYTKNARPTIIYAGIFLAIHNYALPVWFNYFGFRPVASIDIPDMFWATWSGVCGLYVWNRTKEKMNGNNLQDDIQRLIKK